MLSGWEEYNYFINCTAVQLMNSQNKQQGGKVFWTGNEITLEELDEKMNKSTKFCFINKKTKWKYEQKHQILVESLAGLGFGERIMMLTEKYPILSYANNKQVIMRCCSYN
jgi:hypothetical protein